MEQEKSVKVQKKKVGAMEKEKTGKYIKEKRTSLGMTQQQLADKIQVTEKAVSRWETGRGAPDISLLLPLAKELKVSAAELLNGEDDLTKSEETVENKTIENVITYAENAQKQKYNPAFKASVLCFITSFLLFLLYLREAYRFQGNYFGTLVRIIIISAICLLGEWLLNRYYLEKLDEKRKWKRVTLFILFLYYVVMLLNLTFLERTQVVCEYNFVPFRTILKVIAGQNLYAIAINIFGNLFIFMPLEFFLLELFKITDKKKNFVSCVLITAVIEIAQYIFKVGVMDVDDMILCVSGMMLFYNVYRKYLQKWIQKFL